MKLNNNNASHLKTDSNEMACSDASFMHLFWQNSVESEIQTRIMEFAATMMGEAYLFTQTCKQWDEILNQNPDTADPIWHRIAKKYYGDNRRHLRHLEIIDSACRHEDNTELRRLLFIKRSQTVKIFSGEMGNYLKLLAWAFSSDHINPYDSMYWKEGTVGCRVSANDYWLSLGVGHESVGSRGIFHYPVQFTDESIVKNFENMSMQFMVQYLDHDYTTANFDSECRIIHRWLHMFGFHHYDFEINLPVPLNEGMNGNILVRLIDCYTKGGGRTLCLGSMTIKDNTSKYYLPSPDNDILGQNHGWWEQSAEEGKPIEGVHLEFDS
jgi:hypothetical protein